MLKLNKKFGLNSIHNSYKYIASFCLVFAAFNFFIEKIAVKNQGKNNPQVVDINLNQVQSYKPKELTIKETKPIVQKKLDNVPIETRKKDFIAELLPIVHNANQNIIKKREQLFNIERKIHSNSLNVLDSAILKKFFNEYKVKNQDLTELKKRIDIIPVSLVIAQAAIESGWGTSRFAQQGNAYFGQKVIGIKANGIQPNESKNPKIKVRSFANLNDSVLAYLNNLNTHFAYKGLRKSRHELRSFGKILQGEVLANQLDRYSELGNEYVHNLQKIIKKNNLNKYDFIEYQSARR